ncbi:geranylgeranylglycerol-phosphate geranylgeranyltransferase [Psychroflexus planctonicus]|nr:geranylgeranylglycerol-phosphate geranylgeranyltransferase [Psychroflexus planctonicus]
MQTRILAFVNLIRLPNLIMLALVQVLMVLVFLPAFIPSFEFETWKLISLISSVCFIAAGGNLINAYFDQQTDLINKSKHYNNYKHLGKRRCLISYAVLSTIGLILGFWLSFNSNNYLALVIYGFVFISLFMYSKYLKGSFLVGNILVSLVVGLSLLLPWVLGVDEKTFHLQDPVFQLLLSYILFAAVINFARELAKDAEDVVGDFATNHQTFAILMGKKRTQQFIQILVFICLIGLVYAYFRFFAGQLIPMLYIFLALVSSGIIIFVKTGKAKHKKDFSKLSMLFKIWMFLGLISLGFYGWV